MSIFLGSTEITAGKLNLGSQAIAEVYLGSQKIWPIQVSSLNYVVANGNRSALLDLGRHLALTNEAFRITMYFVRVDNDNDIVGDLIYNEFIVSQRSISRGTVIVAIRGTDSEFGLPPSVEGEVIFLDIRREANTPNIDVIANGFPVTGESLRIDGVFFNSLFLTDENNLADGPGGFWLFKCENRTTGEIYTLPMDEDSGNVVTAYSNGVPVDTATFTPDAEWIPKPPIPVMATMNGGVGRYLATDINNPIFWQRHDTNRASWKMTMPPKDGTKYIVFSSISQNPVYYIQDNDLVYSNSGGIVHTFTDAFLNVPVGAITKVELLVEDSTVQTTLFVDGAIEGTVSARYLVEGIYSFYGDLSGNDAWPDGFSMWEFRFPSSQTWSLMPLVQVSGVSSGYTVNNRTQVAMWNTADWSGHQPLEYNPT